MEFMDYYHGITKKVLLLTGQWPYQKKIKRMFALTFVTLYIGSIGFVQVSNLIHCDGDTQCIVKTIPLFLVTSMTLVKMYTCHLQSSKIKTLIGYLLEDWKNLETSEEYEIMKFYGASGRQFVFVYTTFFLIATFVFVLVTLTPNILDIVLPLNESRPLIRANEAYYFVDERDYFFYIYLHNFVGIHVAIIVILGHDCTYLNYIEDACSTFAVAGYRFENVVTRNKCVEVVNENLDKIYNKKIASSVHAHWRAIRFSELLENIFYLSLAIQLAITVVALSITLLQVAIRTGDFIQKGRYMMFVISEFIHLYVLNLQGQKLIDHSVELRDKIYNCSWYNIPIKPQKQLIYVMRRSLQPNFLSAGKLYVFSLKSFTTALQTSMSYFTVLASLQ